MPTAKNMGGKWRCSEKGVRQLNPWWLTALRPDPAVSQQNTFVTHTFMFLHITSTVFSRPLALSSGPALNKWGVIVSCFLAPDFTMDVWTKCVFKDTERQTTTAHSYTFIGEKELNELDLTICSHDLQSTYFYRKVNVKKSRLAK
jgi:hypothetical protein